ncbi:protein suppressor of white apricot-like [Trichoplusia ni]|uniref:Protein suppressor of white apricot-like n=1 Tax=Trichoplusia ni TaxID=7111 RepID=A0A7E5WJ17_TRINI|nr:protein suppressor of white apricot-like [Trichoplusia ni]
MPKPTVSGVSRVDPRVGQAFLRSTIDLSLGFFVHEKPPENEEYLHPSLASTVIESAPAIPSIHYKPSADCDYTMLISKMRGEGEGAGAGAADVAPPGTSPPRAPARLHLPRAPSCTPKGPDTNHVPPTIPPVLSYQPPPYYQYPPDQKKPTTQDPPLLKSTGLSLMKNYNTDSDSDVSDFDDSSSTDSKDKPTIITPPEDVQIVIDKMASYVARNGDEFADIVRAKNDPRFTFLEPDNQYHAYYRRLMQQKRGIDVNGKDKKKKASAPVSFSIKKLKEPDPILPKPALPYESSSDEDSEKQDKDKQTDKPEEVREPPKVAPQTFPSNDIPPTVVYKIDGQINEEPPVKAAEPVTVVANPTPPPTNTILPEESVSIPKQEPIVTVPPETTQNH